MSDDTHQERSRLVQRQKKEMADLEKELRKRKGAMREAIEEKIEETEKVHAEELIQFDKSKGIEHAEKAKPSAEVVAASQAARQQRNWSSLAKAELEEECLDRGLSKKGSKEELITRLMTSFSSVAPESKGDRSPKAKSPRSPNRKDDDSDDESDGSDSESDSGSEPAKATVVVDDPEEAAKQYKRERIVQKAILHLFEQKFPHGFPLEELPALLEKIKVSNFKPQSLGYESLHEFARKQPRALIRYDKYKGMIHPVVTDAEGKVKSKPKKK